MEFVNSSDQRLARRAPTGSCKPTFPLPKCTDDAAKPSAQDWSSNTSLAISGLPASPHRGRSKPSFLRWCLVLGALLVVLPHAESRSTQQRPTSELPPCTSRDKQPPAIVIEETYDSQRVEAIICRVGGRWAQQLPPIAVIGAVAPDP